jgi:ribosomal protein L16 Arg81 hydroxylase
MSHELVDFLAPLDIQKFFSDFLSKQSVHVKGGAAKAASLFSWHELNRILEQNRLAAPQLRLVQKGKSVEDLDFMRQRKTSRGDAISFIDTPSLYRHLKDGASLVLDAVDEMSPSVGRQCQKLGQHFATHFSVNAYAAWGSEEGFGLHWDDHDVFVLQIEGRKRWQLYGPARRFPLDVDVIGNVEPPKVVEWEALVSAGDVIYIPRGHWHRATAVNEPTLHLTFGFITPTAIDWLQWVVDSLRENDIYREDIPIFEPSWAIGEYESKIKTLMVEAFSERNVSRFLEHKKGKNISRSYLSLPFAASNESLPLSAKVRFSGISYAIADSESASTVVFQALGREWLIAREAERLALQIFLGNTCCVIDLLHIGEEAGLDNVAAQELLGVMLSQGLIHVVDEARN